MAIKRDYYEVLGVPRDASDEEIKRSFRRAAQRHHPDIDSSEGAEERFKELNEAYRVLSDRQRRSAYDMFGHAGVDGASAGAGGGFGGGFGPFGDIFDAFFGGSARGGRCGPAV
jgi:molecular chaperone DnaJ